MTAAEQPLLEGVVGWPENLGRRYRADGYWPDETLDSLFALAVARDGDAIAVRDETASVSYDELNHRVDRLAAGLVGLGIGPRDRVVVQLPNSVDFVVTLLALIRCRAVPVLALPAHRQREIAHFANHAEAVAYVIADRHHGYDYRVLADEVATAAPRLRHVLVAGDPGHHTSLGDLAATSPPAGGAGAADPADVVLLLVSGGTTGRPKLIPRTHRDYVYNARASAEVCAFSADDVYLVCLPAGHNFPLACPGLFGAFSVGASVVMCPAPSPDVAFDLIERHRVTITALVPPLARLWCDSAGGDQHDRSSLRLLQVGGAKLDTGLARRIEPELGCHLQQVFGMAEGLLNYTRLDDSPELVATTQGRPLCPADELLVVDRDDVPVEPGAVGELLTRGPYTVRGYYRAPEANATSFTPDGYYRSGDLVRQLPTGHLVVEGRVKEVINRGGENVATGELEDVLAGHPAVAGAAVLGLPDEVLGESVCAVVTLAPGVERPPTLPRIRAFLTGQGLARFMMPDRLEVVDQLPLTAVGKIAKSQLSRDILGGNTDAANTITANTINADSESRP